MSLLPKTYTHFCTKCNQPYETSEKIQVNFGDILCQTCQEENNVLFKKMISDLDLRIKNEEEDFAQCIQKQINKSINFELRGDDLQMIKKIKQYTAIENEDVYSWLCYLENEIKEQIKQIHN